MNIMDKICFTVLIISIILYGVTLIIALKTDDILWLKASNSIGVFIILLLVFEMVCELWFK